MTNSRDVTRTGDEAGSSYDDAIVGGVIAGRFRVDQRVASGGMATVFLAEDLKHSRRVAVKVLHETLAHTIGVQRFLREIEVIARLQHPHLLTLIDSGDFNGLPYYVMPYVEGQSLREFIAKRGKLSFDEAIRITQEIADGLQYAHQHGVVHRDIKPSNILMSGGHAIVADFGIATALQRAAIGRITETGISLGSPTYMSPEQAAGERDLDARTDIYSLACVLFEMVANHPPIDHASLQQVVTRKLTNGYTRLRELRPDVPLDLEAAIHRALASDRGARFATMQEFAQTITAALPKPEAPRRLVWIMAAAVIVIAGGAAMWIRREARIARATQRVAEVSRLAVTGDYPSAFELAQEILPVIPSDSTLRRIRPTFTDFIKIVTVPPNAQVSMQRLDAPDSVWTVVGRTPIDSLAIPKLANSGLDYRFRIEHPGFKPVEMLANVFADLTLIRPIGPPPLDTIRLDSTNALPGMVRIPGGVVNGVRIADYHIGRTEVTNREFARFVAAGGYEKREYWTEPMVRDGKPVPWEAAMRLFRDRSGESGPATWINGTYPAGQEDYPVGGVSYFEAAAYARFAGMRLPTYSHWNRAALRDYREFGWTYLRTSNVSGTEPRQVAKGSINSFGLFDVAGNVREWCVNPLTDGSGRAAMGGGWEDPEWQVGNRIGRPEFDRGASNGLRLVALTDDEATIARLSGPRGATVRRDFRGFTAVSDAEFAVYRRMFDYDHRPIDARIEAEGVRDAFRWQKASFSAGYGGERMMAYILLPKSATGPFEPVIFWPPGGPINIRMSAPEGLAFERLIEFLPHAGRALVLPLFKGSYERDGDRFTTTRMRVDSVTEYRDIAVQWVKDLRRTIDYLETRADMRSDRVGFYGVSWGGQTAPLALAIESRIKAAVINAGGYNVDADVRAEVNPANYTPRVRTPVLMLSGQHDNALFPYQTSQRPFFDHLGTPLADKQRHEYSTASHILPQEISAKETIEWFDRYLRR